MNRLLVVSVLSATVGLLLGAGIGFRHARVVYRDRGGDHDRMVKHLSHALKLSDSQRVQVAAILKEHHDRMRVIREETRPKMEAIRTSATASIRKILTPDQQLRFDRMQSHWEKSEREHHQGPPFPEGENQRPEEQHKS